MQILKNFSLRDKNTFHIGGAASYYAEPLNQQDVISAIEFAQEKGLPVFFLGKGSNVLISDMGWQGLVINLSAGFNNLQWCGDSVQAESGVLLNNLVNQSIENCFSGMEELAGIPGTAGGAVIMNAGAFNSCIADTLSSVQYYDMQKCQVVESNISDLALGYRTSLLKNRPAVILSASFNFTRKSAKSALNTIRKTILKNRKAKQPLEFPNCGSVFKRPEGGFAGTMIEHCGLKGLRIGDAEVSVKHANFIINRGKSTAADVRQLIKTVQAKVFDCFGVILEPEVIFIGEFEEPLLNK